MRTGVWGKDIIVPPTIAGVLTAGVAVIPVAAVSGYRAHQFEKDFWDYIKKTLSEIGKGDVSISDPVSISLTTTICFTLLNTKVKQIQAIGQNVGLTNYFSNESLKLFWRGTGQRLRSSVSTRIPDNILNISSVL